MCCERWHRDAAAPTAEALMRSRYCAYVLELNDYLLDTWHVDTRPASMAVGDEPATVKTRWLGLKILRCQDSDADHAVVEFVARYRRGGDAAIRLHESSRFLRENGRWYYVDGEIKSQ